MSEPTPALARRGISRGVYVLPALFTLGNVYCGYLSLAESVAERYDTAAMLLFLAGILDGLDGRVARLTGTTSAFGEQLDSLADVISFGVAPAALGFAAGLRGGWDWIALIYFVCCGVSRLARYNVTAEKLSEGGKVRYFEGTPIPTSVVIVGVLAFAAWQGRIEQGNLYGGSWAIGPWSLHAVALLYALSGTLMISKTLRIPKL